MRHANQVGWRRRGRTALHLGVVVLLAVSLGSVSGFAVEFFNDLWQFSEEGTAFQEVEPVDPPPGRKSHRATGNGDMYVFGGTGVGGEFLNDIWEYDPATNTWTETSSGGPPDFEPRGAHTVVRREDGNVLIFGGVDEDGGKLGDLWEVNPETGSFEEKAPFPGEPRLGHCAAIIDAVMYVFGGFGGGEFLNDIWEYDPATNQWSEVTPTGPSPPARVFAACVVARLLFKDVDGFMAFGGVSPADVGVAPLDDAWMFNFDTQEWEQKADMPTPLESSAAVKLPSSTNGAGLGGVRSAQLPSNAILLFGGRDSTEQPTDTTLLYDIDTDSWQTLDPDTTPPARAAHTLAEADGQVLLFGGANGAAAAVDGYLDETPVEIPATSTQAPLGLAIALGLGLVAVIYRSRMLNDGGR